MSCLFGQDGLSEELLRIVKIVLSKTYRDKLYHCWYIAGIIVDEELNVLLVSHQPCESFFKSSIIPFYNI